MKIFVNICIKYTNWKLIIINCAVLIISIDKLLREDFTKIEFINKQTKFITESNITDKLAKEQTFKDLK